MLNHLNVNFRFIGRVLKRYKETEQVQTNKKTGRKRTVRTKAVGKKVRDHFSQKGDQLVRTFAKELDLGRPKWCSG
jgi:hypothetical protein